MPFVASRLSIATLFANWQNSLAAIRWIDTAAVLQLHDDQLAEHGGLSGIRDAGLLDSALARPRNLAAYADPDIADLAAAYGFGLASNHPFIDGNKRISLGVTGGFLGLNGYRLHASDSELVQIWLSLASGHMPQEELAQGLRERIASIGKKD